MDQDHLNKINYSLSKYLDSGDSNADIISHLKLEEILIPREKSKKVLVQKEL